jgi:hypothetical protein
LGTGFGKARRVATKGNRRQTGRRKENKIGCGIDINIYEMHSQLHDTLRMNPLEFQNYKKKLLHRKMEAQGCTTR